MSLIQFAYNFSASTVAPGSQVALPPGTPITFDAAYPYLGVTKVWVPNISSLGNDNHDVLMRLIAGVRLYVRDEANADLFVDFTTTAPAIDRTSHVELPVTYVANGTAALRNNQPVAFVVITTAPLAGPLVPFSVAKTHLRVTDDDHDEEIRSKLDHASAIIVDYMKARADPNWTETTAPLPVQAAVLYMLGLLYEHRGDDFEAGAGDFDEGTWNAVARLLMRLRDPALA